MVIGHANILPQGSGLPGTAPRSRHEPAQSRARIGTAWVMAPSDNADCPSPEIRLGGTVADVPGQQQKARSLVGRGPSYAAFSGVSAVSTSGEVMSCREAA